MPISLAESLSVLGNSNHLDGFLGYYENRIEKNQEAQKPLTHAPNYFAWISTASEQVFYRIREMIYVNMEDHRVFDEPYKSLLDRLFENHELVPERKACFPKNWGCIFTQASSKIGTQSGAPYPARQL